MTPQRRPSAVSRQSNRQSKKKPRPTERERGSRGQGITHDERGQVQPKDKETAQRTGSHTRA